MSPRRGRISSWGRSTCCSTLTSTIPSIPDIAFLILLPVEYSCCRSSPNSLIAIWASVPESIASMRCEIGCPISIAAPGICDSLERSSASTSLRERSFSLYGASSSEPFTPCECSSNSARPVLRATVSTSGVESMMRSASAPMASLCSSDMPGSADMFIVNEPSLKPGKKLRPKVKNNTPDIMNSIPVPHSSPFL